MGVRLPAEYQEVEYIESNGAQYVNTGITINVLSSLTTEWYLRLVPTVTNRVQIFAGVDEKVKQIVDYDNRLRQDWVGGNATSAYFSQNIKTNEVNTIMQKDGLFWLNEEYAQIKGTASDESFVYLFGKNKNGSPETSTLAKMRLYGFTAKTGHTKIADFVPCYRKLDTKPGLYDLVSRTFITNQGTGEFLVGPDVLGSISPLMVAWRRMLMRQYIGYEENKGFTEALNNASTGAVVGRFLTGFIPIKGAKRLSCYYGGDTTSGSKHFMVEYNGDKIYTNKDGFWDMTVKNQRTVTLYTSDVQYVRFSGFMDVIDQCYVKNADTGEILWKKGM